MPPSHRPCPFCHEPIRVEAIKCRHCRRLLDESAPLPTRQFAFDFWGPVAVVVGGIALVGLFLLPGRGHEPSPQPPAVAAAPEVVDGGAAPDRRKVAPPEIEEPAALPRPPRRTPGRRASPRDRAPAKPEGRGADAPKPEPVAPPRREPEPEPPPSRPRELKSDLFGYGLRLPNEDAWQLGFAGASRHMLVRRDLTARIQVWTDVSSGPANAEVCLRRHLSALTRRLVRAGLRVRSPAGRQRRGGGGLTIRLGEREAIGSGPRRHAGKYLVAFAAEGPVCYGFEGFAAVPASRAARREVRTAFQTFDVDPAVRTNAPTAEVRRQLERLAGPAEQSGNATLLLDTATAWAALWPDESRGWHLLGIAHLVGDRPRDALGALQAAMRGAGQGAGEEARLRSFGLWTLIADANSRLKQWPAATAALSEAQKLVPDHPGLAYARACVEAMRGEHEKAMDSLEASFRSWPASAAPPRIPHGLGMQVTLARRDLRLRSLRKEPRFEILLRRFEARARKAQ